jgi:hypothetical protein
MGVLLPPGPAAAAAEAAARPRVAARDEPGRSPAGRDTVLERAAPIVAAGVVVGVAVAALRRRGR